jgi:predicted amidophosphoribosyltransferase
MLVTCPECGTEISDQADPCPHCGFPAVGQFFRENAERRPREWDERAYPYEYVNCKNVGQ